MMRVFVAMSLAVLLASAPAQADEPRELGALSLRTLTGEKVSVAGLRGKVVVLNFWATWCQPCVAEFPDLADLASRYSDKGVVVVAASIDEEKNGPSLTRFAKAMPEGMQLWVGATTEDMQRLGLGASIPVTVLLGRDGRVAAMHRGPLLEKSLDALIARLLEEEPKKKIPGVDQAKLPNRNSSEHPVAGRKPGERDAVLALTKRGVRDPA